jgi:thiamine monophosphate synthase
LKTDLDNIATTRSQLKEAKQQHLQASEECRLQSESKTSQLRDKGMELDSILRVLEEAEKMCQLEHEQGTEKVVSLKEEL